ncbi:MAG: pyridoxal phosphate-dependent aminotransferase [Provencibacterium sp.]|jgi:cystathionine beta-lyase|nr:pyridoxal phosphate-dependent aminotransferase [Provencibacterium sp.]
MPYDFETLVSRLNAGSVKWEGMKRLDPSPDDSIVPLSVADMEFKNPPEVMEGLKEYLDSHILGYACPTEGYLSAVQGWMKERHQWEIEKEWIVGSPGVVSALYAAVRAYSKPGDGVLLLTPVYPPFYSAAEQTGRKVVRSPLVCRDGHYRIDFEDLSRKAAQPDCTVMLLCSPHNPVGRVWTEEELRKIGEICLQNGVTVVADEIHSDLIMPGYTHTVFASLGKEFAEHSIVCTAPSKTFNLAGMQTSNILIPNEEMREKFAAQMDLNAVHALNILGYRACEIAYTRCAAWLDALIGVLAENHRMVCRFLAEHFPMVRIYPLEGTYLEWIDFRGLGLSAEELESFMQKDARLYLDEGYIFGEEGKGFERINIACPSWVLSASLERLLSAAQKRGLI